MSKLPPDERQPLPWDPLRRTLVSLLLAFHLLAVVVAPWSNPPPAPQLAQTIAWWLRPYLVAAYLNHGYRFFAPDPGPSHVVRCEMEMPDGQHLQRRIPDPQQHWPRVIYHRHFMLTETLFNAYSQIAQVPPPEFFNESQRQEWEQQNRLARQRVDRLAAAIARQLLQEYGGQRVRLYLQEHALAFPEDVKAGMRLDDPRLYFDVTEFGPYEKGAS